jgi:DNA gyrase subunit B
LIETLIKEGVENKDFLQDLQKMSRLRDTLIKKEFRVSDILWNNERDIYEMTVETPFQKQKDLLFVDMSNKKLKPLKISRNLVYSSDYQNCVILSKNIWKNDTPPFLIINKEDEKELFRADDKKQLLSLFMEEAKKGLGIQRYKGLGEMNPDQLWETTMNPEKRMLLQVKVEDDVETDEIFTVLMGEEVEPRRDFISSNALEVSMLDI